MSASLAGAAAAVDVKHFPNTTADHSFGVYGFGTNMMPYSLGSRLCSSMHRRLSRTVQLTDAFT